MLSVTDISNPTGLTAPTPKPDAQPGQWLDASVNGMNYRVLLPDGYDPSVAYSTTLYLHQLDMGNDPIDLTNQVDAYFNTAAFRAAHPTIVVMPLLDQSADPSGQTINFGGISSADTAGETNALAALAQVQARYSTNPAQTYVTGNSMGGIGTEDLLVKYNAYTGTQGRIFAAGLALAGADYGQDPAMMAAVLKNVPYMAIHGGQDTQVPLTTDQTVYADQQASGGDMIYTQDNSLGHNVWDTYYTQTGANAPLSWLYGQSTGGSMPASPMAPASAASPPMPAATMPADTTAVATTSATAIPTDMTTADTTSATAMPADTTPDGMTSTDTTHAPAAASTAHWGYTATNGTIYDDQGAPWVAHGLNVMYNVYADNPSATQILAAFPGANFVRLPVWNFDSPASMQAYVDDLTAHGLTVELENHQNFAGGSGGSEGSIFTGANFAQEQQWYHDIAGYFGPQGADPNDKVVFSTANEPSEWDASGQFDPTGLSDWQAQTVASIRDAGNPNLVLLQVAGPISDGVPSLMQDVKMADYAALSNTAWAPHDYGWMTGFSTAPGVNDSLLSRIVSQLQAIPNAQGVMPVLFDEAGNATDGTNVDANATNVIGSLAHAADTGLTSGYAYWAWGQGSPSDGLTDGNGDASNPYGQQVAAAIQATAAANPDQSAAVGMNTLAAADMGSPTAATPDVPAPDAPPMPAPIPVDPNPVAPTPVASPDDTTVMAGSSAALTDASGNQWTITDQGQVAVNDATDMTTANVTALAYVGGTVWQENQSNLWWGKTSPDAAWAPGPGTPTSPLPAPATMAADTGTETVSQSQVSFAATTDAHMVFVTGSGDTMNPSGETNTVTDTGRGNTYVLPAAGQGKDRFTSDVLASGDTLDLRTALSATDWNGAADTLPAYLAMTDTTHGAKLSIAATAYGTGTTIASIHGATGTTLTDLLSHAIT